jgi:hypothetical protein
MQKQPSAIENKRDKYNVNAELMQRSTIGVQTYMRENKLTHGAVKSLLVNDTGNSGNTHVADEKTIRSLNYFFALIGDYGSMLMLNERPPVKCPSMNASSL